MKVFYINTTDNISNATAKIMLGISESVRMAGGKTMVYAAQIFDRVFHALMSRLTDREGEFSYRTTRRIVADIVNFNPDIIHLSNIHGHYINYELLFAELGKIGKPVVWSIHDMWPLTGHCAVPLDCESWMNGCVNCQHIDYYPKSWFANRSAKNFEKKSSVVNSVNATIVVGSEYMADMISKSHLSGHHAVVIPNGVDTSVFRLREPHEANTNMNIIGVARNWEKGKNIEFFNKLKLAKPNWNISLVGKISSPLADGINAIGYIEEAEKLAEIYSSGDVFVNPSMFESFGMVVFEAMACGLPVVVNSKTATAQLINDKVGCSSDFAEVGEVISLIEKALKLNREDCSDFVAKNYSIDKTNTAYIDLYKSLT